MLELERHLGSLNVTQVRHDLLCQRDINVDEFREGVVQVLKVRHEVGLQNGRILQEVFDTLRQLPG